MISLKTIQFQTSFSPNPHAFPYRNGVLNPKTRHSLLCLCKSSDDSADADADASSSPPPEGDPRKQDLLARIAMLQTQKVRLTDYLDERSEYLTKFAEEANAEFEKIGEDILKDLDESSNSIIESIESKMQAFEESAELNRMEIQESERKLLEFEDQLDKDRNEGLFFQGLRKKAPVEKEKAEEETKKIEEVTREGVGSKTRSNIYIALMGVSVIGIADSFLSGSPDWRKVAVLAAILVGLLTQFSYEQMVSAETNKRTEDDDNDK